MIIYALKGVYMVTMKDIAEEAGVSRTTVSFVLNGRCNKDQRVSKEVQKKVLDTAKRLGYMRNDLVLSMVKGRSQVVGIVSEFRDFSFPIIRGYAQEAQNHGYSIRLFQVDGDLATQLSKAIQSRVDAIVCLGISNAIAENVPEHFFNAGIPIVGLNRENTFQNSIFDQQKSSAAMVEYLVQCGYKKIICCGGNYPQMVLREAGYREIMIKYQLEELCFNYNSVSPDDLIDLKPDAIFCGDDYFACRLLQAAHRRNLRIPDAFGVAGFGNTNVSQFSSPALTTVEEPFFESGVIGMKNVVSLLKNGNIPEHTPMVGELVIRESTKNIELHNNRKKE